MRLKRRYVAVLAVFTLFIAGCSKNLVGRMAGDGSAERNITFAVTDIPPQYEEMIKEAQNPSPASRSILPNAPFAPNNSALTFVLTGTSNSGEKLPEANTSDAIKVTLSGTGPYTFTLPLGAYVWDLTLTAYKDYPTGNPFPPLKPVLQGHCTVDLTMGNAQPEFNMSIKGLTTPGTVKVTGTVKDPDRVCTHYEIGIYNLYTGEFIEKYTDIDGSPKNTDAKLAMDVATSVTSPFPFSYEKTTPTPITLNPGAYEYRMIFYKGATPNFIPIGSYSDTIVVYPGNALEQGIGELDVLNKKPTKPTSLRAYRVNNSEDKEQDYYYVKLTWKPSQFETNYELKLKTSSDDGTTFASEKVYGFKATNNTAEDFLASPIWYAGSLAYGSTNCTLKLQLGKVYEVSIQARNYIGESDWVERLIEGSTPAVTEAGCTYFEALSTTPPPTLPGKHINRRRIKYDLNGGKLILDAGTPTPDNTFTDVYVKYDSYTGTATPLLEIKPSNTATAGLAGINTLTKQTTATPPTTLEWQKWRNQNNGQEVPFAVPAIPTGIYKHENVFVKADFGFGITATVTPLPAPQDLLKTKIKITYDEESGTAPTLIAETPGGSNHYPVPKHVGSKVTWITVAFDGLLSPPDYDDLHCTAYFASGAGLWSKVDLQAVGNVCTFSTGEYTPQTFTLKVMAKDTATNQMRSQTYIIELF